MFGEIHEHMCLIWRRIYGGVRFFQPLMLKMFFVTGILADEMGLGKTIQTIALFAHLVEMGVPGPFLVVAPLSTIANWVREFKKFAPMLPAVLYHGNAKEREAIRNTKLKEIVELSAEESGSF